jgi:hypothetical protein
MRRIGTLVLIAAVLFHASAEAQTIKVPLARLHSASDTTRMAAFYEMAGAADAHAQHPDDPPTSFLAARAKAQPNLAIALIDLLERENAVVAAAPQGSLSGDYLGDYVGILQVTVARMNDPRSLGALIPGIGSSDVVSTTIAGFGEAAVAPTIAATSSTDRYERVGAVRTMKKLLTDRTVRPLSVGAVGALRETLLRVLTRREDAFTRVSAVEALGSLSDDGIRAEMAHIAATDTTTGYAPPGRPTPYPVKAAAQKWLAKHP